MEYITVECMNMNPHKAHSWREGFLWLRKRECGGVPKFVLHNWDEKRDLALVNNYCEADVEMTTGLYNRLYHRHKFQLKEANYSFLVWECKDCPSNSAFVQARFVWVSQTVYRRRLDDNPWEV